MLFNLDNLLSLETDLSCLIQPFSREEIDRVTTLMPLIGQARGPNGFNGIFMKNAG